MKDLKELGIALGVIIGVPLVAYGITEANWQANVATMKLSISNAKKEILDPTGGSEISAPTVTHGESFLNGWFCVGTNCPQVESKWKILVADGKYDELRSQLTTRIKQADKSNKWRVSIFSEDVKIEDYPFPAPTGKAWTELRIFVYQ